MVTGHHTLLSTWRCSCSAHDMHRSAHGMGGTRRRCPRTRGGAAPAARATGESRERTARRARCEKRGLCLPGLGPLPHSRLAARTRLSRQATMVPDPHPAARIIPHTHVVERPADRVLPVLLEVGGDLWENRREVCNFLLRHRHLHVAPGVRAAGGAPPSARG